MSKKSIKAADALMEAQKIAFAPFIFQVTITLRRLGVLDFIFENRQKGGVSAGEISEQFSLSPYGTKVLLEFAESSNLVETDESGNYSLTKIGYFLNYNNAVDVNMNFTQDICYQGLFHLDEAIKTGQPSGLKELGNWDTIYEGLSQLTKKQQQSWFEFDHYYSDGIFEEALQRVFKNQPNLIYDIGGNTGKFALQCFNYDENVKIRIFDLPGQLQKAIKNLNEKGFGNRLETHEINWLKPNPAIPKGADVIWMSQFLDCFSEEEILKILTTCVASMDNATELIIIETFTDRQEFSMSKFILEATSLYFTVMANGNSKMYASDVFLGIVKGSGLTVEEDLPLGEYHTMLVCKKK